MKKKIRESLAVWKIKESLFPKNGRLLNQIKFLVRYAVLAPSGHNSQPWKFYLDDNYLSIEPDFDRRRQAADPWDRELFISLGCAAKNIEVAAAYFGLIADKEYLLDGNKNKFAIRYRFQSGHKSGDGREQFLAITKRQTNRSEYDRKIIEPDILESIKNCRLPGIDLKIFHQKYDKALAADLIYHSHRVWFKSRELVDELDKWLRDDVDGINEDKKLPGFLNFGKITTDLRSFLNKDTDKIEQKALRDKKLAENCSAIVVVTSSDDSVKNWIKTGEAYEELALKLTHYGLSQAFFNTVVQLKTQREKLTQLCGGKCRPQLMLRIGYAKNQPEHTPRRHPEEVLVLK